MASSVQTLSESERRLVAEWAATCAERVLWLFEAESPSDDRPRAAIARTRAFAGGELDTASPWAAICYAGLPTREFPNGL